MAVANAPPIILDGIIGGAWLDVPPGFFVEFDSSRGGRATASTVSAFSIMSDAKYRELFPTSTTYCRLRPDIDRVNVRGYFGGPMDIVAFGEATFTYRHRTFTHCFLLKNTFVDGLVMSIGKDFLGQNQLVITSISKYEQHLVTLEEAGLASVAEYERLQQTGTFYPPVLVPGDTMPGPSATCRPPRLAYHQYMVTLADGKVIVAEGIVMSGELRLLPAHVMWPLRDPASMMTDAEKDVLIHEALLDPASIVNCIPLPLAGVLSAFPTQAPAPVAAGVAECPSCGAAATLLCTRCRAIKYCSRKCQARHWRQGHRESCRPQPNRQHAAAPRVVVANAQAGAGFAGAAAAAPTAAAATAPAAAAGLPMAARAAAAAAPVDARAANAAAMTAAPMATVASPMAARGETAAQAAAREAAAAAAPMATRRAATAAPTAERGTTAAPATARRAAAAAPAPAPTDARQAVAAAAPTVAMSDEAAAAATLAAVRAAAAAPTAVRGAAAAHVATEALSLAQRAAQADAIAAELLREEEEEQAAAAANKAKKKNKKKTKQQQSSSSGAAGTSQGAAAPAEPEAEDAIPECFVCPITTELMEDPVMASDGFVYERRAIANWLARNGTSPKTREVLTATLTPAKSIKASILDWQQQHTRL